MTRRRLVPLALSLALVLGAWLIVGQPAIGPRSRSQRIPAGLVKLESVDQLRARFQADAGKIRLILLLSPTCPVCQDGAQWVQREILAKHPAAKIQVYAVWVAKLSGDRPSAWDGGGLTDSRVVHFWDGQDVSGRWFSDRLLGYRGSDWDAYLLFGPNAVWDAVPAPLRSSGTTIIGTKDELARGIAAWLDVDSRATTPSAIRIRRPA